MEHANLPEKNNRDPTAFAFADFSAKTDQESFDVLPGDVRARWMCEDSFKRLLMGSLHAAMVP